MDARTPTGRDDRPASPSAPSLVDRIDALLPQTQCTRCGFPACRPYAEALADGGTALNRCPPGGQAGIEALAVLLERPALPLDPACGEEGPLRLAVIDESLCIGCTKCIQACPVDAIAGANRRMHTVIPELCTGCELCVAPCPVDCIVMRPPVPPRDWTEADADAARARLHARRARLAREAAENDARLAARAVAKLAMLDEEARAAGTVRPVSGTARVPPMPGSDTAAASPDAAPGRPLPDAVPRAPLPDGTPTDAPDDEAARLLARKRATVEAALARARARLAARMPAGRERP